MGKFGWLGLAFINDGDGFTRCAWSWDGEVFRGLCMERPDMVVLALSWTRDAAIRTVNKDS